MRLLNIDPPDDLVRKWERWLAPEFQPFIVTADQAAGWALTVGDEPTDLVVRGTFNIYQLAPEQRIVWLDEATFHALPGPVRTGLVRAQIEHDRDFVPSVRAWSHLFGAAVKEQAGGHRFVWWRSLLDAAPEIVLRSVLSDGLLASRHAEVAASTWDHAATLLPRARNLAGTYADGAGPNCFGTVMAAAGVPGADEIWMQREPFEEWLAAGTRPGGRDDEVGTVLLWRSTGDGSVQHAAVTLGDGWAVNKSSQSWTDPRMVLSVPEVMRYSRTVGWRLTRHRLR
jgi:hypothetical protein